MKKFLPVFALLLASCAFVVAQEHAAPQATPQNTRPEDTPPSPADQLSDTSAEAAKPADPHGAAATEADPDADDHHAPFKYSATVKWIGRKTGIDYHTVYWISVIFNFLVIAGALYYLLGRKIGGYFQSRNEAIRQGMEEARKASEQATKRLAEIEARLSRLDSEIAGIRSSADAATAAEEERMRLAADEEKARIVQSAEQEIASAAKSARAQLKSYAADLAVDLAEKRIAVNESQDAELVRSFTSRLGKDGQ